MEGEDGQILRDDEYIGSEISRFYKDLFTLDRNERPFVEGLHWCPIDHDQFNWLEWSFELDQFYKAVFEMEGLAMQNKGSAITYSLCLVTFSEPYRSANLYLFSGTIIFYDLVNVNFLGLAIQNKGNLMFIS